MTVTAAEPRPHAPATVPAGIAGLLIPPAHLEIDADSVDADVLPGILLRQARRLADGEACRVKTAGGWRNVTWRQSHGAAVAVAAALVRAGLAPGERVAILSENRLEWLACDFGAQMAGCVVVPIYASSTAATVETILRDSGAVAVVCSTPAQATKLREARSRLAGLRIVALMEGEAEGFTTLHDLVAAAVVEDVEGLSERLSAIRPDDLATIIYTSGTTGSPKGVMLTQANLVGSARSLLLAIPLDESDLGISFLPWAHVYERAQGIVAGAVAGFPAAVAPDLNSVGEDLRAVRPTAMNAVPRLYEKVQEAILAQIRASGGWRAALGLRAIEEATTAARLRRGGDAVPIGIRLRMPLWERLVLARVRARLGGRARIFACGGGPIGRATLEFFDGIGIGITEGYGLTETTGAVTVNDPADLRFGTVGRPTAGHEIRVAADGEILVRGPGVMRGYFNDPEATAEVLRDGWFATGDVGEIDAAGYLTITDRKKDLIVTSGGKNVAPAPIEGAIAGDPLVERAIVIGDRRKYLVALVVPNFGALRAWAQRQGIQAGDGPGELAAAAPVREYYEQVARRVSASFARYEGIKKVAVLERDLSEERGELTPTLKVKRRVVSENFAQVIEALYAG